VIKQLVFLSAIVFSLNSVFAAEVLVKTDTLDISGYSAISDDKLTVYGGIAGPVDPVTGPTNSTVDTCADSSIVGAKACNQVSVHYQLPFTVSFQVTKDVSNALAKMYIDDGSGSFVELDSQAGLNLTANSTTVTLSADWGEICSKIGASLSSSCVGATVFATRNLKIGVDSDASNDVEDAERKTISLRLHYISPSDTVTQNYCTSASGSGMCNLAFIPGDQKVFIDSAIYAGPDPLSGSFDWESIAIFPIPSPTVDGSKFTGFIPNQASPIFRNFDSSDGTIPDSSVTGGLENGQGYCFVYGTKNVAQNIYRYVTDINAAPTACKTPSEVVGLLEDKACFISTAAFGSEMAPEVKTFRAFRNKYLLTNLPGKLFVKTYYKLSPPLAKMISKNETLRTVSRGLLYPFLFYASLSLSQGILLASLLLSFTLLVCTVAVRHMKYKRSLLMIFILLLATTVKAGITPDTKEIQHESAKEGLVRITKDGTYIYNTERPLKSESSKITFGMAEQPSIELVVETGTSGTQTYQFGDLYSETSSIIVGYDYENYPVVDNGKLGYQLGVSLMFASGNGVLVSTGETSAESFTFLTMPVNAGAVYRFEYKDKQFMAPYVSGGGTLLALIEKRDDVAKPNVATGFGFYGAGGILLNASVLDAESGFQLESEYGISNLWLAIEFRVTEVNSEAFSFSNKYVNAGLSFDF